MAHLFESRTVADNLSGIERLCRVVCIGDSIMYGQGVWPRQTFPAHLTRMLNAAFPHHLVWCDNRGESSGNVWHAWDSFRRFADGNEVDVLILSICENDSQIFESNTVRYSNEHKLQYWEEHTPNWTLVRAVMEDLRQYCNNFFIHPIALFYTYNKNFSGISNIVRRICEELCIDFIDLLEFFHDQSGISVREYQASPFDGHPSSLAHETCARRVARVLSREWVFRAERAVGGGTTLAEAITAASLQMMDNGTPAPDVVWWSEQALAGKEAGARRAFYGGKEAPTIGDTAEAREAIAARYRAWFDGEVCKARAGLVTSLFRNGQAETLGSLHGKVRNLSELAYCAEVAREGRLLTDLANLLGTSAFFRAAGRLRPLPHDWSTRMDGRAKAASDMARAAGELHDLLAREDTNRVYVGQLAQTAAACASVFDRLATRILERSGDVGDPACEFFWQVCEHTASTAFASLRKIEEAVLPVGEVRSDGPLLFTRVSVLLEGEKYHDRPFGYCNLTVECDYIVPERMRHRDKLWADVEHPGYLHVFEVPVMLAGNIRVGVPEWEPLKARFLDGSTRLSSVEIKQIAADGPEERAPSLVSWRDDGASRRSMIEFKDLKLY